jgi:hypothetical protein
MDYCAQINHIADNHTFLIKYNEKKFQIYYFSKPDAL